MMFVDGDVLEDKIKKIPLMVKDAMKIAEKIAEDLATEHEKGVVQRDLKSANFMITTKGMVTIMDYELANLRWKRGD